VSAEASQRCAGVAVVEQHLEGVTCHCDQPEGSAEMECLRVSLKPGDVLSLGKSSGQHPRSRVEANEVSCVACFARPAQQRSRPAADVQSGRRLHDVVEIEVVGRPPFVKCVVESRESLVTVGSIDSSLVGGHAVIEATRTQAAVGTAHRGTRLLIPVSSPGHITGKTPTHGVMRKSSHEQRAPAPP